MSNAHHTGHAISAVLLSQVLHGAERRPTEQQAAVTSAEPGPMLVVAGAGAGKTETMASRVVWLVANGYATPDQILGLTFTRKAAQELGQRIRRQFRTLAGSPKVRDLDPGGELADVLLTQAPTVSTYDSYAGQLIREYGLLVPVEPHARLITQAELYSIAHRVVTDYRGPLSATTTVGDVTEKLLRLVTELDNQLADVDDVAADSAALADAALNLPAGKGQRANPNKKMHDWHDTQRQRIDYLPLVEELKRELNRLGAVTFNEQMSVAARLARDHAAVRAGQRNRFRVVMLDEYQDTSHSQRVLLSSLFGTPGYPAEQQPRPDPSLTVTAVGDPMQAIYGWRGATVENLEEFVNDFPTVDAPAPKRELTTSWRNPGAVLRLANAVSERVFAGGARPVAELEPRDGAGAGDVALGLFAEEDDEIAFVADRMAAEFRQAQAEGRAFKGAVLVRKNRHSQPVAQALAERGIPYEIVGLGGLLLTPEIADLVALARMLIRPGDNRAALRILSGPLVGLGLADLMALKARARNLTGSQERPRYPEDPVERLKAQLEEVTASPPDQVAGLTDAIADLGERSRYSEEAVERLELLSARLRHLRTHSLSKTLPDLFVDIAVSFGVRAEVLAQHGPGGAVNIDQFLSVVGGYHGDSLSGLLDYFDLAVEMEDGLEAAEVVVRSDRVQILTGHKAKGLEWDVVSVLHADAGTYRAQASTFLTNVDKLPDSSEETGVDVAGAGDRKELEAEGKAFVDRDRANVAEENARLFYVAITRTERVLTVTASGEPYEYLQLLADTAPESVVVWEKAEDGDGDAAESEEAGQPEREEETAQFPVITVAPEVAAGADLVRAAMRRLPEQTAGETFDFWEREVDALIEEQRALAAPEIEVELPAELTATDLVMIKSDPMQFARRQRRPVPFKPNTYAKRGTAFHQWLEDNFGQRGLLDEEQLPGLDEEVVDAEDLEELKEAFQASEWAERTPVHVEQPFEVRIGDTIVRGRMDAIFRTAEGRWLIVDWKTGQRPQGAQLRAAEIQLAVYREAWRRIVGEDEDVAAAFFYVRQGDTFAPATLPDGEELAGLLTAATGAPGGDR